MTVNLPGTSLELEYRDPAALKPDPRNARTHPKRQIKQIMQSMETFGFTSPILIDEAGVIIAGHGRLLAAKALKLDSVPTIALAGLDEVQKRALRLADNKIALNAGWDVDLLRAELGAIAEIDVDFDLTATGFATGEIDVLLGGPSGDEEPAQIEPPVEPRTKPGDIYMLGDHRLGCGDARDVDFLKAVCGEGPAISAAFMDPPYNVRSTGS